MPSNSNSIIRFISHLYKLLVDRTVDFFMLWRKTSREAGKKLILLVDDKVELINLLKFRLIGMGYEVVTAENGVVGLERLKKTKPDLIVLDINMPKMGGLEFFKHISSSYGRPQYPVLFLTERIGLEDICRDVDADGFLAKPFEVEAFAKEVERILNGDINPTILIFDCGANPHVKEIIEAFKSERYQSEVIDGMGEFKSKTIHKKPKFIVIEYMQKDTSGEDLIKQIKANPFLSGVPVIVYSYSGFEQYRDKSLSAGADKYIGKPEGIKSILSAMKELELNRDKSKGWSK